MFTKILVPLDQSPLAESALGLAASIACGAHAEVSLVLAHRPGPDRGDMAPLWSNSKDPAESVYVHAIADELARVTGATVSGCVKVGKPVDVICKHIKRLPADLVVMTSHGRTGFSRAWLGSVADGVIRESSVPVLMLRAETNDDWRQRVHQTLHKILVPLDEAVESEAILAAAAELARCTGAKLLLSEIVVPIPLYVFEDATPTYPTPVVDPDSTRLAAESERERLTAVAQRLEVEHSLRIETDVTIADHVAPAILDLARRSGADLIAMCTHSRGASRLVVGSVADKVMRASHLPLLLYHPARAHQ